MKELGKFQFLFPAQWASHLTSLPISSDSPTGLNWTAASISLQPQSDNEPWYWQEGETVGRNFPKSLFPVPEFPSYLSPRVAPIRSDEHADISIWELRANVAWNISRGFETIRQFSDYMCMGLGERAAVSKGFLSDVSGWFVQALSCAMSKTYQEDKPNIGKKLI